MDLTADGLDILFGAKRKVNASVAFLEGRRLLTGDRLEGGLPLSSVQVAAYESELLVDKTQPMSACVRLYGEIAAANGAKNAASLDRAIWKSDWVGADHADANLPKLGREAQALDSRIAP